MLKDGFDMFTENKTETAKLSSNLPGFLQDAFSFPLFYHDPAFSVQFRVTDPQILLPQNGSFADCDQQQRPIDAIITGHKMANNIFLSLDDKVIAFLTQKIYSYENGIST